MKLLALAAVALAGTASTALDLRTVILKPAQVGKGYILVARNDGFGVKSAPTLDLCGRKGYTSEKLRSDRLQVNYLKQNTALGLSNEVVAYKPGGAKKALGEVLRHAIFVPAHTGGDRRAGRRPAQVHDHPCPRLEVARRVRR